MFIDKERRTKDHCKDFGLSGKMEMPITEIRKTIRQVGWKGKTKQSVLDMIKLRHLLDSQKKLSGR